VRRTFARLLAVAVGLLVLAPVAQGATTKYVILIDWDAFDPDYIGKIATPNLDALRDRGALVIGQSTFQTISNPARASMVTGAYPERHHNIAFFYDPSSSRAVGETRELSAETIAESLSASGKTLASVQWYMTEDHGTAFGDASHLYLEPGPGFSAKVNAAIAMLHLQPVESGGQTVTVPKIPDFMALYGADLDQLGHQTGPDGPNILPTLASYDADLGRLVQATQDVGIFDQTAFILTGDHGMSSWTHNIAPEILDALRNAGFQPELVVNPNAPGLLSDVVVVPSVRTAQIFLRGLAASDTARARALAALQSVGSLERIFTPTDLAALHAAPGLGDFVVEARPPNGIATFEPPSPRGGHGGLDEIQVPFYLAGPGFPNANHPTGTSLIDVAPTIAALLGTRAPAQAQGRALAGTLKVLRAGTGVGSVQGTGIDCGTDCDETYQSGFRVRLTPVPDVVSQFDGWNGDCTGRGACVVTIDRARSVTALFSPDRKPPALTGFKVSPVVFRAQNGTRIRFNLNEPSRLTFVVTKLVRGRDVGLPGAPRTRSGKRGTNEFFFPGAYGGHRLAPGRYRVTARATDRAGNVSSARSYRFLVVR
jgi:arylsulfatase A-like enzyme